MNKKKLCKKMSQNYKKINEIFEDEKNKQNVKRNIVLSALDVSKVYAKAAGILMLPQPHTRDFSRE